MESNKAQGAAGAASAAVAAAAAGGSVENMTTMIVITTGLVIVASCLLIYYRSFMKARKASIQPRSCPKPVGSNSESLDGLVPLAVKERELVKGSEGPTKLQTAQEEPRTALLEVTDQGEVKLNESLLKFEANPESILPQEGQRGEEVEGTEAREDEGREEGAVTGAVAGTGTEARKGGAREVEGREEGAVTAAAGTGTEACAGAGTVPGASAGGAESPITIIESPDAFPGVSNRHTIQQDSLKKPEEVPTNEEPEPHLSSSSHSDTDHDDKEEPEPELEPEPEYEPDPDPDCFEGIKPIEIEIEDTSTGTVVDSHSEDTDSVTSEKGFSGSRSLIPRLNSLETIPRVPSFKTFRSRAIAIWDYVGPDTLENKPVLQFKKDQEIQIISKKTDFAGWGWGELDEQEGLFPLNYVKVNGPPCIRLNSNVAPKIKELQDNVFKEKKKLNESVDE